MNKPTYRILIVDDEERLLRVLRLGLKRHGFDIHTAQNGQEALQELLTRDFDLILTDIRMPEMGGDEFVIELNRLDYRIPVVVMTAYADVDSAVKTLKHGAKEYIKKPFSVDELLDVLMRVLKDVEPAERPSAATLKDGMEVHEKSLVEKALLKTGNNKSKAAKLLNISERSLFYKIKKYNIPG